MERRLREKVRRHLRKPRQFNIQYLGLQLDVSPTPAVPGRPWSFAAGVSQPKSQRRNQAIGASPKSAMGAEVGMINHMLAQESVLDAPAPIPDPPEQPIQQPSSGHPDPLIGRTATVHEKHERIRVKRREATLKRQAELMSRCECRSECNCRANNVPSNAASLGNDSSERHIQVPTHPLQGLLSEHSESTGSRSSSGIIRPSILAGVGSHLFAENSTSTADALMIPDGDGRPFLNNRLSQASTAYYFSNGSSISISSRRPASLRRSNTTPASIPRHSVDSPLYNPLESLRDGHPADHTDETAMESPTSPEDSEYNEEVAANQNRENSL
ncbi:MAG: hypothetical protein Q9220_004300 [cf. Caloplaca sp. 1 TL-2023]